MLPWLRLRSTSKTITVPISTHTSILSLRLLESFLLSQLSHTYTNSHSEDLSLDSPHLPLIVHHRDRDIQLHESRSLSNITYPSLPACPYRIVSPSNETDISITRSETLAHRNTEKPSSSGCGQQEIPRHVQQPFGVAFRLFLRPREQL